MLGLLFYSYNIKKIGLHSTGTVSICLSIDNYFSKILAVFDIICTMILPFIIITIINGLIGLKLINVNKNGLVERTQISEITENTIQDASLKADLTNKSPMKSSIKSSIECSSRANGLNKEQLRRTKSVKIQLGDEEELKRTPIANFNSLKNSVKFQYGHSNRSSSEIIQKQVIARKKKISRANKFLFSISISFLVCHAPIALIKFKNFRKFPEPNSENISNLINENKSPSVEDEFSFPNASKEVNATFPEFLNITNFYMKFNPLEHIFERLTTNIYYVNFILNFFLYSLNGSKFRESLLRIFKKNIMPNRESTRNVASNRSLHDRNQASKSQKSVI